MQLSPNEFQLLKRFLLEVSGIDIPENKQYLFKTRLGRFVADNGFHAFSEFYHTMRGPDGHSLIKPFVQSMTTHESSFFRDKHPFQLFKQKLLPDSAKVTHKEAVFMPVKLRILSAGCSKGQEPYSIAIQVHRWLQNQSDLKPSNIEITAVDISQKALNFAQEGTYSKLEMGNHISEEILEAYFERTGENWRIKDFIRSMITFKELNFSVPFSSSRKYNIIFCRNVIIYLESGLKRKVLRQFRQNIHPKGSLILGASENLINISSDFESRVVNNSVYYIPTSALKH